MSDTLAINNGETYTISNGSEEEWLNVDCDGSLVCNGSLVLKENPNPPAHHDDGGQGPSEVGGGIDLPLAPIQLGNMVEAGTSILIMGLLGLLLGAAAFLRNYVAGSLWSLAVMALLASGLFNIGLEVFWALVMGTALTIGIGVMIRWTA